MTDVRFHANATDSEWGLGAALSGARTFGERFQVTEAGWAYDVAWWKVDGTQALPTGLGIFGGSGELLWVAPTIPDGGSIPGWQRIVIPNGLPLATGITYTVAVGWADGAKETVINAAYRGAAPSPYIYDDTVKFRGSTGWPLYPTTAIGTLPEGVDLTWTDVDPGEEVPPTPSEEIEAGLIDWFDPTAATKPAEDPGLYPRAAQKIDLAVWLGLDDLAEAVGDVLTALGEAKDAIVTDILTPFRQWIGWVADDDTALRRPDGSTIRDDTEALRVDTAALQAQLNTMQAQMTTLVAEVASLRVGVGAFPTGWTLLDTVEWDTWIAWPEPANLYVVTITSYPPGWSRRELGDVINLPRAGWWTPLNGIQPSGRLFVDFETTQLHVGGSAMPGLLLVCFPGFEGTVEAWGAP